MRIRCLILVSILLGSSYEVSADVLYGITYIGAPVGYGINKSGQITGRSAQHAFIYSNGQLTELGSLDGHPPDYIYTGFSINDRGQITGTAEFSAARNREAFLYSDGQMMALGMETSSGQSINNLGQVVGAYGSFYRGPVRAFVYSNGEFMDLGVFGASGINDAGQVIGNSITSAGAQHAFIYSDGHMTDLGTLPGASESAGGAINNAGQVTGSSGDDAFLYSNGQMIDLGRVGLNTFRTFGEAINNRGEVTGHYEIYPGESGIEDFAFLYSHGQIQDLNELIDPSLGIKLWDATGINDSGQIVANGRDAAYLLTPVPEPSTGVLLGIISAGTAWRTYRRARKERLKARCAASKMRGGNGT